MSAAIVMQELSLHLGHIDAGWAFPLTTLAANAEIHGVVQGIRCERILSQLASDRQAQRVGATAGQVLFVTSYTIRRTHGANLGFTAGPIVITHFYSAIEALPF